MTDKKLFKKIAPILMSVAVVMAGTPAGVMAEDFTSGDAVVEESAEVVSDEAEDSYVGDEDVADGFDSADEYTEDEAGFGDAEVFEEAETDAEAALFADTAAALPVSYNEYEGKLVANSDVTAEQVAAYAAAVTNVKIGDKDYPATGDGAVQIVKADGSLDYSKAAIKDGDVVTVSANGYENVTFTYYENVYVYAGLTWAQYWAAEGVYKAGDTTSSSTKDRHNETDLGAFDTVTRATANHGLHRGSFQTYTTIFTKSGASYKLAGWKDKSTMILADGNTASFASGKVNGDAIDHYEVYGLKYVPVKVKRSDYAAFKAAYAVVENGGNMFGGFGEVSLKSYTATAAVTANTNGLKTATKNADGSFSFSARANGTDSGLKDAALQKADGIVVTVQKGNGSYGEFLRVDLTGNYGGLGAAMQAVKWTYYGSDSSRTNALQTYGTKFAADNWMHKSNGIQLGLSDSVRCQLPAGTDGTGYWTVTVYGLGYQDFTFNIEVAADNIAKPAGDADSTPLVNIINEAKNLNEADYTPASWAAAKDSIANELAECEDMLANIKEQTTYGVEEQIGHLREALDTLVKAEFNLDKATAAINTYKDKTVALTVTTNLEGTVEWTSSNAAVATVDQNGNVTAVKAGKATITATLNGKSASCEVTVTGQGIAATAKSSTIYTAGQKTTKISVTKNGVTGKAKFTSSNKKVATVSSKGVVTAKKAGKATITVKVGKYTKKVTIQVKNPTLKLAKSSATIKKGSKATIKATATPSGKVTYTSSNKKVATVTSKGVVTGKKKGTAVITVKSNGVSKKFKVTVK